MFSMWAVTTDTETFDRAQKNVILNRACIHNNVLWVVIMQEHCLLFLATLNVGMNAVRYTYLNATLSTEHVYIVDIFMSFFDK